MWHWWFPLQHWLAVHSGTDNEPGDYYGFWSGFAGDLGLFAAAIAFTAHAVISYRHKTCEVHRCWRLARHATAAGHHTCRRHHPDGAPTHEEVIAAHEAACNATGDRS